MNSHETITLIRTSKSSATLTLSNPARRNAISKQTALEFAEAAERLSEWDVAAVRLDAEGPAFCAGADLADLEASAHAVDSVIDILTSTPVYWLAVVHGHVRGAGLAVMAACPRILAASSATFGLPEVGRGFFPTDLIAGQLSVLSARHAFDLAFSGEAISADEARRIGLISHTVPPETLDRAAHDELQQITEIDGEAVREGTRAWQTYARRWTPSGAGESISHRLCPTEEWSNK